jgi:hypothetical protein
VSFFPTLFLVNGTGTVVREFVNLQEKDARAWASRVALEGRRAPGSSRGLSAGR